MRRSQAKPLANKWWPLIGLAVILALMIGLFMRATAPKRDLEKQAIRIATKQAKLVTVGRTYWDRQRDSYVAVAGLTKKQEPVYVLIHQQTGKVNVLKQKQGITASEARSQAQASFKPKRILSVGLSVRQKKFVWDVGYQTNSGKLGYVTYEFATGDQVNAIYNL